jgi:hypothetical protein
LTSFAEIVILKNRIGAKKDKQAEFSIKTMPRRQTRQKLACFEQRFSHHTGRRAGTYPGLRCLWLLRQREEALRW